jgi:hypothetical protein
MDHGSHSVLLARIATALKAKRMASNLLSSGYAALLLTPTKGSLHNHHETSNKSDVCIKYE